MSVIGELGILLKRVILGLMEKSGSSEVLKRVKNRHFNTSDGNFWEFQPISDSKVCMNSYMLVDGFPGQFILSAFRDASC